MKFSWKKIYSLFRSEGGRTLPDISCRNFLFFHGELFQAAHPLGLPGLEVYNLKAFLGGAHENLYIAKPPAPSGDNTEFRKTDGYLLGPITQSDFKAIAIAKPEEERVYSKIPHMLAVTAENTWGKSFVIFQPCSFKEFLSSKPQISPFRRVHTTNAELFKKLYVPANTL